MAKKNKKNQSSRPGGSSPSKTASQEASSTKKNGLLVVVGLLLLGLGYFAASADWFQGKPTDEQQAKQNNSDASPSPPGKPLNPSPPIQLTEPIDLASRPDLKNASGKKLAEWCCSQCHAYADPSLLTKTDWPFALDAMAMFMGRTDYRIEGFKEPTLRRRKMMLESGQLLQNQLVTNAEWEKIVDFYLSEAPSTLPPVDKPKIETNLAQFKFERPTPRLNTQAVTLVKIDEPRQRVFLGVTDGQNGSLLSMSSQGVLSVLDDQLGTPPVWINVLSPERQLVTLIGFLMPTDQRAGVVAQIGKDRKALLTELPRTTHTSVADLTGDGRDDLVVSSFGHTIGELTWYENLGDDKYQKHLMVMEAGAIRTEIADMNNDGRLDIMVMFAQHHETIRLFLNEGGGKFRAVEVVKQHPAFGFTYFELVDMNGDGQLDILTANGDNADLGPPQTKNYHGIRIYINQGDLKFKEEYYYPLDGASKVVASDFDGDGDIDLAAIAFFADFSKPVLENFVYLENLGNLKFKPKTHPETANGRWWTMDVGDIDGDQDDDLVLGAVYAPVSAPSLPQWEIRRTPSSRDSVLILLNQSK